MRCRRRSRACGRRTSPIRPSWTGSASSAPARTARAKQDLPELDSLLTGASVQMARGSVPLARRNLSDTGVHVVTLASAVAAMRRSFSEVAEVISAVEMVWTQMGERLDATAAALAADLPRAAGLGEEHEAALRDAQAGLQAARGAVNADPLRLYSGGRVDTSAADVLREQAAGLTARIAELDRVRSQARRRIDGLTAAVTAARAARAETRSRLGAAPRSGLRRCRRCRLTSPNCRWTAWPRSPRRDGGSRWRPNLTGATSCWHRPSGRPRTAHGPRQRGSPTAMNYAGCSALTRPRPLALGWLRTPTSW